MSRASEVAEEPAINRNPPLAGLPRPGASAPEDASTELWGWLRLVNRHKIMIIGCGFVAAVLMALVIAQQTPMYKASSRLILDTRTFKVLSTEGALGGVDTLNMGAIQSELEVISSEFVIGRVVDKLGLASNPDFNGTKPPGVLDSALDPIRELWSSGISSLLAPAPPPPTTSAPTPKPGAGARADRAAEASDPRRQAAIGAVAGRLSVNLLGRTFVILITAESPDGTMSARIANAVAEAYLADQIDTKNEANRRATEWLEQRLAELRRNLQVAEEAVAAYRRDKGLAGSPEGAISTQTLSELNSRYTAARGRRIEKEGRLVALSKASLNPGELANIPEVAGNTSLAALRIQDVELSRKSAELASQLGDSHPRLIQVRNELNAVRARFIVETQRITLAVRAELDAATSEEEELKELVDKASVVSGTASQYEAEQKQLEREATSNRALYESFLNRFKELREQQDIQRADARILAYARPSGAPSSPNFKSGLMGAFVIGCLLGMAGAIAAEKLDRVFRSAAQVEEATGVSVLAMVPEVKGSAATRANVVTNILENTTSPAAEAVRAVFTAISLASLDRLPRVLAVTSSTPSEGKTTFVASLGGLLTKMNTSRRVLIVDLDLRQAKLSVALGIGERGGTIDEYLMGTKTLAECTRRHEESGVYYICARPNTPNAPEILESHAMKAAVDVFSDNYDLVILDAPPVLAVSDARIIARLADYTVFIVQWAKTHREVVKTAVESLLEVTSHIGIVINRVNLFKHGRYGYGDHGDYYSRYRGYYGQGNETSAAKSDPARPALKLASKK
ncbi:MAG: GumC family protein [Reyranella sp.]